MNARRAFGVLVCSSTETSLLSCSIRFNRFIKFALHFSAFELFMGIASAQKCSDAATCGPSPGTLQTSGRGTEFVSRGASAMSRLSINQTIRRKQLIRKYSSCIAMVAIWCAPAIAYQNARNAVASTEKSGTHTIRPLDNPVATPTFSPAGGVYAST